MALLLCGGGGGLTENLHWFWALLLCVIQKGIMKVCGTQREPKWVLILCMGTKGYE